MFIQKGLLIASLYIVVAVIYSAALSKDNSDKIITVPDDFKTIQSAIDSAEKGTIINIKAGDYEESIKLKSGITIKGLDANNVVIHCDVNEGPVLKVENCNDVKFYDLTLKHTGLENMPPNFEGKHSVLLLGDSNSIVSRCNILKGGKNGIGVFGGNSTISECNIHDNKNNGIIISEKAKAELNKNHCFRSGNNGIFFYAAATGNVSQNTCNENYNGIAVVKEKTDVNLLQNICKNNNVNGIYFGEGAKGIVNNNICISNSNNGITVTDSGTNPIMKENEISDNNSDGIYFGNGTKGLAAENKCFKNNWHGIRVDDENSMCTIQKNSCFENKGSGLYLNVKGQPYVYDNIIHDNCEISYFEAVSPLWQKNFSQLETIASHLRDGKRRYRNGNWQLNYFYDSIGRCDQFTNTIQRIEEWINNKPNSVTARIALATVYVNIAWKERGSGYAKDVTEKGWKGFEENLLKAQDILIKAESLNQPDPQLYAVWLDVARGLSKSKGEMEILFERGIAIEKNYWPVYDAMGFSLAPIWYGKQNEFEALQRAVKLTNQEEGQILYAKIACMMVGRNNYAPEQYKQLGFSYKMLQQSIDDRIKFYPSSNDDFLINASCFFACAYDDKEEARKLFMKIGNNRHKTVWDEKVFKKYKDWALK